jgi:Xaa-Pro aminopeptidase
VFAALEGAGAEVVELNDPTVLPKAIKNPVEQAGHRAAQARDGAAIARFLHWLATEAPKGGGNRTVRRREADEPARRIPALRDLSFDTISGAGPNGAIVHYRVSEEPTAARTGFGLPRRFGRAVCRRHHRHHPHRVDRPGSASRAK